jgi:hypothetical protein
MGQTALHGPYGGTVFPGLRKNRAGMTETVHDDGAARRVVWRVIQALADDGRLSDALSRAVAQTCVVPAFQAELKKCAIRIEAVTR